MRRITTITVLGILVTATGCIRSLHPIYTDKSVVFEQALVGQWFEDGKKETWTFTKHGKKGYKLVYVDNDGERGKFMVHLAGVEGALFLDFFPDDVDMEANGFYKFHILPVHSFVYVKQIEPTLQMSFPNPDWLKEHLAKKPDAIRHEKLEDEVILTAAPADLKAFWLAHLRTKDAFGDPSNLKRQTTEIPGGSSPAGDE